MIGFLVLLLGNGIAALGIALCTIAEKGVDPLTVLYQGTGNVLDIDIGVAVVVVNLVLLLVCVLMSRSSLKFGTLFTIVTFSSMLSGFINTLMPIMGTDNNIVRWIYLIIGTIFMGIGFSTTMYAKVGPSVLDVLLGLLLDKVNVSVKVCKMGIDICSLTFGYLLGGTVGIGTVLAFLITGTVYDLNLKVLHKYFG